MLKKVNFSEDLLNARNQFSWLNSGSEFQSPNFRRTELNLQLLTLNPKSQDKTLSQATKHGIIKLS